MRDYSKYEKTPVLFSGAEKKFEIIIDVNHNKIDIAARKSYIFPNNLKKNQQAVSRFILNVAIINLSVFKFDE